MTEITADIASQALSSEGYSFSRIEQIHEGSNHYIFRVYLSNGDIAICKFAKSRVTELGIVPPQTDTLFGGALSLERESYLFSMVRNETSVPTPRVFGRHESKYGEFILIEALPGVSQKQYLRNTGYSGSAFLNSLRLLGQDFAAIQRIRFPSFGNIMVDGQIEPAGLYNFADRWNSILKMHISSCIQKGALTEKEAYTVQDVFFDILDSMRPELNADVAIPVLNFTDMHAENFFVDDSGKPSGYFDLESAQAAPAALEFYAFRFFLFNFYRDEWFEKAEHSFFEGYKEKGGLYTPQSKPDHQLIDFFAACRLLELTNSYWGYVDGIRDSWGYDMKRILVRYMDTGDVDYNAIGAIWQQRDHQPLLPLIP